MSDSNGTCGDDTERWHRHGKPMPTSALRTNFGKCAYEDCENGADFLVKVENQAGDTTKTRVCESCNYENHIMAERYLPPQTASNGGDS